MLYKELGKTKEKVSILGFGTMRLPTNGDNSQINEKEASDMLTYGIENGINLIDTAYSYHSSTLDNRGNSEIFLGEFLKENNYRDDVILTTKSPSWLIEEKGDFDKYLDEQLKKLQTDQIDLYLLHSLTEKDWEKVKGLEVMDFLDDALSSGKIKHVGFSAHTEIDYLIEIVDDYPKWEAVLTQMNYLDEYYQSGIMGLDYLKNLNIGTMVMEPLRGGRLVQNIPPEIMEMWKTAEVQRTPVEWALQYLWNREDVDCVLSGMNTLEQVKENVEIASRSYPNTITAHDEELIREVARKYRTYRGNECTACGYCMPCPYGVNIVDCFNEYNLGHILQNPSGSAMQYFSLIDDDARADSCIRCMECEYICPQMLNIPDELEKVVDYFGYEFNHF